MDKKSKYETLTGISFIVVGLVTGGVLTVLLPAVPVMAGAVVGGVLAASAAKDVAKNIMQFTSKIAKNDPTDKKPLPKEKIKTQYHTPKLLNNPNELIFTF